MTTNRSGDTRSAAPDAHAASVHLAQVIEISLLLGQAGIAEDVSLQDGVRQILGRLTAAEALLTQRTNDLEKLKAHILEALGEAGDRLEWRIEEMARVLQIDDPRVPKNTEEYRDK